MVAINKKPLSILVVEDQELMQPLLRRSLNKIYGVGEVIFCESGQKAMQYLLDKLKESEPPKLPNLVILDIGLAGENGLDTLEQIKDEPKLHNIPVIIYTASEQKDDIVRAYKSGGAVFVRKSGDDKELIDAIGYMKMANLF